MPDPGDNTRIAGVELRTAGEWPGSANDNRMTIGPGLYEFLPLQGALAKYEQNRRTHSGPDGWRDSWFPFMTQGAQRLYLDCDDVTLDQHSPVRLVSWEWDMPTVARAWSLTHAVTLWVWLLESDYYLWEAEGGYWEHRPLPELGLLEWPHLNKPIARPRARTGFNTGRSRSAIAPLRAAAACRGL